MNPPASTVIALVLVVLLLLVLLVLAFWLWRRRRPLEAAEAPLQEAALMPAMFEAAMRKLYTRDGRSRYERPLVLVCGPGGAGKSEVLRGAGLAPVAALPGKDSGWWRSTEGDAFELPPAAWNAEAGSGPWLAFLRLLNRHRPLRGLDAVVWVIPFATLDSGAAEAEGERMYRKLADIQDYLGLSLPVYVVVGGCDAVPGYAPWAGALPRQAQVQPLGWSNPTSLDQAWRPALGEQGVERLANRLRMLVSSLTEWRDPQSDAPDVFLMPERIAAALVQLPQALQAAMRESAIMVPFELRGFYLSGRAAPPPRTQAAAGADTGAEAEPDPYAPLPAAPPATAPVFCRELFAQRIFGEFGLGRVTARRTDAQRRQRRLVLGVAGALAALWLVAIIPTYFSTQEQFLAMRGPLLGMRDATRAAQARGPGAGGYIDAASTQALVNGLDRVPHWTLWKLALPLSWTSCCGGIDHRLDRVLQAYNEKVLFAGIDHAMHARADKIAKQGGAGRRPGGPQDGPGRSTTFATMRDFVDDTVEFERQLGKYRALTTLQGGSWSEARELLSYLFDLQLAAGSEATSARFDATLRASTFQPPGEFRARYAPELRNRLEALHAAWLDDLFGNNQMNLLRAKVIDDTRKLAAAGAADTPQLAQLQQDIGQLRVLLAQNDSAWLADSTLAAEDVYRRLETRIRSSALLGDELASRLQNDVTGRQARYRAGVLENSSGLTPVLAYTKGKELLVSPGLGGLETALGQLLRHQFAQGAVRAGPALDASAAPLAWDPQALADARALLADLEAYEENELPAAPPAYAATLSRLARLQDGAAIARTLNGAASPAACDPAWRCANFETARLAIADMMPTMRKLELNDTAELAQQIMDEQAFVMLRALRAALENGLLYLPAPGALAEWNGQRAALAYSVQSQADMQDYLQSQLELVTELSAASKGPRAWLAQPGASAQPEAAAWLADWNRIDADLARYAAKSPDGSLRRLEQFLVTGLDELDSLNCGARLAAVGSARGDFFQRRLARIAASYRPRCQSLAGQAARAAYAAIAGHYNARLLDRYPFTATPGALDADPGQVRALLQLLDTQLAAARMAPAALASRSDPQALAAAAFLDRLAALRPLLAALLAEDAGGGPAALDLWPQFRINRPRERGADQVIEWRLDAGAALPPGPDGALGMAWRLGDPVGLSLRWAINSPLLPAPDPARPGLDVVERVASWEYRGPWALLRLLSEHAAPLAELGERDIAAPVVLRLVAPTRDAAGVPGPDAVGYARIGVMAHGKRERLALAPFPTRAAPPLPDANTSGALVANQEGAER